MNTIPSALQEKGTALSAKWSQLAESTSLQTDAFFQQTAVSVWGYSDYVAQMSLQQPQLLMDLFVSQDIHKLASRSDYLKKTANHPSNKSHHRTIDVAITSVTPS